MTFNAFISYSHAADGRLAPALQGAMQRLAKPWYRARALRVFRDESALSANPHLWSSIQAAIDDAEWFVLLASPDAVASEWVNRELTHWLTNKSADRILVVLTGGTWEWDADAHAMTGTAVPHALREAFGDEPRHVDVRWARSETDLDLRNSRFRDVVAQVAAPLHGVAKDELEGEDIRLHRRARRLARGGVTVLALLVVISLVFGAVAALERNDARHQRSRAVSERDRADRQARLADARRLATIATSGARDDLSRSALLAIEANRLVNNAETRGAILSLSEDAAPVREIIHGSWNAAAVTADGRTVATVGPQGISIVDLQTRRSRSVSTRNFQNTRSVSFSPDGDLLALGGDDVEILDARTGAPVGSPLRFADRAGPARTLVVHVHFSPDGSTIAAIDNTGLGYLWSLANRAELAHFETATYGGGHSNVAFSPDGRWLTVTDSHAVVYDARSFPARRLVARYGNAAYVGFSENDVVFSPDGTRFAAATGGGLIVFRDSATGAEVGPVIATGTGVDELAFSPDGATIAGSRPDGTIAVWDTQEATNGGQSGALEDDALLGRTQKPLSISFAPDGALVVLTTAEIVVLDASVQLGHEIAPSSSVRGFGVNALVVAPDGRSIAACDGLGRVRIWSLASGKLERTIAATTTNGFGAQDVAYQPGTHNIVVGAGDGTVTAWDVRTGRRVHDPLRLTPANTAPDGTLSPGRGVFAVAFDALGNTLAAETGDGRVVVLDPTSWKVRRNIQLVNDAINWQAMLAMSPDGNTVAVAAPRVVEVADIDGTHRRHVDTGPFDATSLALQPHGRLLAIGVDPSRVLLVDLITAHVQSTLVSTHGFVGSLAFDSRGTTLAVGGSDGAVTLWAFPDRQPIGPPLTSDQSGISGLAFSPDGAGLYTASFDLSVLRYDLRSREQIHRLCAVIGRNLTPEERRTYLGNRNAGRRTCPNWPAVG